MTKLKQAKQTFLQDLLDFQGSLNGKSQFLDEIRLKAAEEVRNIPLPHKKDEDWRFISLRDLYSERYELSAEIDSSLPDISEHYLPESEGARLVFVNGTFSGQHSATDALPDDVEIGNIADLASDGHPLIEEHLGKYGHFEEGVFSSFKIGRA